MNKYIFADRFRIKPFIISILYGILRDVKSRDTKKTYLLFYIDLIFDLIRYAYCFLIYGYH